MARPQPDPGLARVHAALATDGGEPQPLVALRRDHFGGGAWLGAFGARTPNYSDWFGLFHVPQITSPDKEAARAWEDRHILFAYVLLALIAVHLGAALWHHFVRRDRVTARMIDGKAERAV